MKDLKLDTLSEVSGGGCFDGLINSVSRYLAARAVSNKFNDAASNITDKLPTNAIPTNAIPTDAINSVTSKLGNPGSIPNPVSGIGLSGSILGAEKGNLF
ncbi:hypothetical protein ACN3E9_05410 [Vibrio pectenicida]|uniref:hypothetical protein n=1 Tax=Vibrio pectenicida TaxID=62763 RepID=UPI003B9DB9B2